MLSLLLPLIAKPVVELLPLKPLEVVGTYETPWTGFGGTKWKVRADGTLLSDSSSDAIYPGMEKDLHAKGTWSLKDNVLTVDLTTLRGKKTREVLVIVICATNKMLIPRRDLKDTAGQIKHLWAARPKKRILGHDDNVFVLQTEPEFDWSTAPHVIKVPRRFMGAFRTLERK